MLSPYCRVNNLTQSWFFWESISASLAVVKRSSVVLGAKGLNSATHSVQPALGVRKKIINPLI